jgi:Tol biopolymer transport system component
MAVAIADDRPSFDAGFENHLGLTFSPDGKTAFWVEWNGKWGSRGDTPRTIYLSSQKDGEWSPPVPAPFSGQYDYKDPFVSPDGAWLYFISDRPSGDTDETADNNIWRYSLLEEGPMEFLSVNSEAEEYSPFVTDSGALFFASDREGGYGQGDIYRAASSDEGFGPPALLGPNINSEFGEWNMWVAGDESGIIFESSSRPTNISIPGDLYYSARTDDGWTEARPITSLNSEGSDLMPRLHPDGKTLYYTTAPLGGHARIVSVDWPFVTE